MTTSDSDLLTVPEVAAALRVDPQTVRRWIADGRVAAVSVGAHYRVTRDELTRLTTPTRATAPLVVKP